MVAWVAHITDGFGRKTHNSHPSKLQVSRALSIFVLPLRLGTSYSCNSWGARGNRMEFMESQEISELTRSKLVAVLIFGDLWYLVYVCLDFQGFLGQKCEARPNVRNYWPFTRGGYMQRTGTPAMGSRLPHQTLPSRSPLEGEGWSILSLAAAAQFDMVLIYKDYSQTPSSVCSPVSVKLCMQKLRAIYWNVKVLCTEGYCNGSLTCQLDVNWMSTGRQSNSYTSSKPGQASCVSTVATDARSRWSHRAVWLIWRPSSVTSKWRLAAGYAGCWELFHKWGAVKICRASTALVVALLLDRVRWVVDRQLRGCSGTYVVMRTSRREMWLPICSDIWWYLTGHQGYQGK